MKSSVWSYVLGCLVTLFIWSATVAICVIAIPSKDVEHQNDELDMLDESVYLEENQGIDTEQKAEPQIEYNSETDLGGIDYSERKYWVDYPEPADDGKMKYATDVFFICPSFFQSENDELRVDIENDEQRNGFADTVHLQKGIYEGKANFFAPYYREMTLNGYYENRVSLDTREQVLNAAYEDIKAAFKYYLENINPRVAQEDGTEKRRAIVLAGFSQGSDMLKRLLTDSDFAGMGLTDNNELVAAYLIGWNITDDDVKRLEANGIHMAESETDLKVVVSFCSEAISNTHSVIVPEKTNGINPLTWSTSSEKADCSLNKGFCYVQQGEIQTEWSHYTGAYLDPNRGTLKLTDVDATCANPQLGFLNEGDYHCYDWQIFYRDLEYNVQKRIAAYHNVQDFDSFKNLKAGPTVVDKQAERKAAKEKAEDERKAEAERKAAQEAAAAAAALQSGAAGQQPQEQNTEQQPQGAAAANLVGTSQEPGIPPDVKAAREEAERQRAEAEQQREIDRQKDIELNGGQ